MTHRISSLSGQLLWRVGILSVIALIGVLVSVLSAVSLSLMNNQRQIRQSTHKYAHDLEWDLIAIERELLATARALPYTDQSSLLLRDFLQQQPSVLHLHIVGEANTVLLTRQRVSGETDFDPTRPLITTDDVLWHSDVYTTQNNVPLLDIAAPAIYNDMPARLVATIDLTSFWDVVRDIEYGESGYAYIAGLDGRLLAYRDLALVQQGVQPQLPADIETESTNMLSMASWVQMHRGLAGQRVLTSAMYLQNVPWIVVIEQPISELRGQLYALFAISATLAVVIVLLVVSTNQFVRRQVVAPLVMLRERIDGFRQGDFKQRLDLQTHTDNEITVLAHTFNDMAGSIDQRTQELVVARAEALESSRLKSEFLSVISHELRTPLNAIIGYCDLMLEGLAGEFDAETRRMLESIDKSSGRLLALIEDLLDLSKIEAGKVELNQQPFHPAQLAQTWQVEHQLVADEKHIAFVLTVDPNLPDVLYGDPDRITQIATNLITNALKFTESGQVRVDVQCHQTEWAIIVTDTGIGIPQHAQAYIFDAFRQVDSSSTRAYNGIGLGLSIVRNLCRLMGGSVEVESESGSGSTFTARLPVVTQPHDTANASGMEMDLEALH